MPSSGIWRRVNLVWTYVSEERIASIFRVEKSASEEPGWASGCRHRHSLQPPAQAGSSLADFSTLKMEVLRSSVTSVHKRSTRRHIPEDGILHSHRRENLKTCIVSNCLFHKVGNCWIRRGRNFWSELRNYAADHWLRPVSWLNTTFKDIQAMAKFISTVAERRNLVPLSVHIMKKECWVPPRKHCLQQYASIYIQCQINPNTSYSRELKCNIMNTRIYFILINGYIYWWTDS
jgi:hypothetical protein